MSDLLLLLENKSFNTEDNKKTDFSVSEFYITDIKLEKISYQKKEVEDYVKENKLAVTLDNISLMGIPLGNF